MNKSHKAAKPYGSWTSPITPNLTGNLLELSEPHWAAGNQLLWRQRQSTTARIMRLDPNGKKRSSLDPELSFGGGLLYGGGSFSSSGQQMIAVEAKTSRLHQIHLPNLERKVLLDLPGRASSPILSPTEENFLLINSYQDQDSLLVSRTDRDTAPTVLDQSSDFYNYPRWHPDGSRIAWISWNHPHMPWDSSYLYLASLENDRGTLKITEKRQIAGSGSNSILQPEFSPDGRWLAFVSEQTGWWQIFIHDLITGETRQVTDVPAEHGLPPWLQNQRSYGFSQDSQKIFFIRNTRGIASLWKVHLINRTEHQIKLDEEYCWLEDLAVSPEDDTLALIASSWNKPQRLITVQADGRSTVIQQANSEPIPEQYLSKPIPVSWENPGGKQIFGLFYPPRETASRPIGNPPLLIIVHSGPTRQKWVEFQPKTQFFTSRGYAVLEINYRGSTGYGRSYRNELKGQWGVVEVSDLVTGAQFAARQGWVNPLQMALYGSSAGGFTVLKTLVDHPGVFQAAVSLYGISNQLKLMENPPKFERYYSEWLIGPYPEQADLYRERSPLFSASKIVDPVIIFQGGKDPIVPPQQAEEIVAALAANQVPHEYVLYPSESHGFKETRNIQDCYTKIDNFLQQHLFKDQLAHQDPK